MPIVDVQCTKCDAVKEIRYSISSTATEAAKGAKHCGQPMRRLFAAPAVSVDNGPFILSHEPFKQYGTRNAMTESMKRQGLRKACL